MSEAKDGPASGRSVALVTLGCARNEVDSEELAGRLTAAGWRLVDDAGEADVAVVNTCGFVEQAKKDSIDALLEAADLREDAPRAPGRSSRSGCLAERYGTELAGQLPEADAVLGFDSYTDLSEPPRRRAARARAGLARAPGPAHAAAAGARSPRRCRRPDPGARSRPRGCRPPHGGGAGERPTGGASAAGRAAVGTPQDRLRLRPPLQLLRHPRLPRLVRLPPTRRGPRGGRLAGRARRPGGPSRQRELHLVRQGPRATSACSSGCCPTSAAFPGSPGSGCPTCSRPRSGPDCSRSSRRTPGVVPYFDLSFQHAAPTLLRRMRRFGGTEDFLGLLERIRALAPQAGVRSNVIVGFPGETEDELAELEAFLEAARLDVVGVFGYSDEDGTEAAASPASWTRTSWPSGSRGSARWSRSSWPSAAEERIGERVQVLVEEVEDEDGRPVGRAAHQGPDVDGVTVLDGAVLDEGSARRAVLDGGPVVAVGDLVRARVVSSSGADLVAQVLPGPGTRRTG